MAALDEKQEAHRDYRSYPKANWLRRFLVQQRSLKTNLERCHKHYNQTLSNFLKTTKNRWKFINSIKESWKLPTSRNLKTVSVLQLQISVRSRIFYTTSSRHWVISTTWINIGEENRESHRQLQLLEIDLVSVT